jgi:hypothetical protein
MICLYYCTQVVVTVILNRNRLLWTEGSGGGEGYNQRDGRGLTRVLTHAFLRDKVFCVHSVLEHHQQQLGLIDANLTLLGHSLPASQAGLRDGSSL